MNPDLLDAAEVKAIKAKKKSNHNAREAYPVWLTKLLKDYDKVLEAKLPNEFRGAITGYNHRSSSDYLIDENKYGFF
jgi:hypothetical protein